ncbi:MULTISPECIES: hypothetical protein, partial [unclassified Novosphingobium]
MSLHLINNVKDQTQTTKPGQQSIPGSSPETKAVRSYLATNTAAPGNNQAAGKTGCTASVKRHIW